MKDSEKNRDPERARKRAIADARCALRKLDWLAALATYTGGGQEHAKAHTLDALIAALNITEADR